MSFIEFRAYVGPRYYPHGHEYHYPWNAINLNTSQNFEFSTTLSETLLPANGTSVAVASKAGFVIVGGVWVGPNGAGEGWEYIPHSSADDTHFLGIQREPEPEHNGNHTVGATVKQWWAIGPDTIGEISGPHRTGNDAMSASTWTISLRGANFPQPALRRNHEIVIQSRPAGGTYVNTFVGFITSIKAAQDGKRHGKWNITVSSVTPLADQEEIDGFRVGEVDLASQGTATSNTVMVGAYKEAYSGDYVAANPSFDAANAADGDASTIWIGEQMVGTSDYAAPTSSADPVQDNHGPSITKIYLGRPPGYQSTGYRFIELTAHDTVQDLFLCTQHQWLYRVLDIGEPDYDSGQKIIICENEQLFTAENPTQAAAYIFEIDSVFFDQFTGAGGIFGLQSYHPDGEKRRWRHMVAWGNILATYTQAKTPDGWRGDSESDDPGDLDWGSVNAAPAFELGQYLCYRQSGTSTDPADYWFAADNAPVGYEVNNYDEHEESANGGALKPPYLKIDLTPMGLQLASDITDTDPGNGGVLEAQTADGALATAGLDSSGIIQIAREQMAYSVAANGEVHLSAGSARGVNGTTPAEHKAGDEIRQLDGSLATSAHAINQIRWSRNNTPYPTSFTIYGTQRTDGVRTPESDSWTDDWFVLADVTGHASTDYTLDLSPARRLASILIVIHKMSADPARVRINEVFATLSPDLFDDDWTEDPMNAGTLIKNILMAAGIPPEAITVTGSHRTICDFNSPIGGGWSAAVSTAEYAGAQLVVGLDSRIEIRPNAILTGAPYATKTWNSQNARSVDPTWPAASVKQLVLTWIDDAGEEHTASYPAEANQSGTTMEAGPVVLVNETVANRYAERLYQLNQWPYRLTLEAVDGDPNDQPFGMHHVTWTLHDGAGDIDRDYVVTSANHSLADGRWATTLDLIQFGRESET